MHSTSTDCLVLFCRKCSLIEKWEFKRNCIQSSMVQAACHSRWVTKLLSWIILICVSWVRNQCTNIYIYSSSRFKIWGCISRTIFFSCHRTSLWGTNIELILSFQNFDFGVFSLLIYVHTRRAKPLCQNFACYLPVYMLMWNIIH